MGLALPQGPTGNLAGLSADVVVGVGYNIDKHHSLVGQFMWAGLPIDKQAFLPISIVNDRNVGSSSNLFALTANYKYRLQGNVLGVYWIGGGGLYYRRASLSGEVVVGAGTACGPFWQWHGFGCVDGIVTDDRTLVSTGSTALGANAGMGLTIRINEDGYKFYIEPRYHYAPTKGVSTQLLTITFGFAW